MNGWLVVARCAMDDIPLRLEKTEIDAWKAAKLFGYKEVLAVAKKLRLDTSEVFSIHTIEFKKGVPQTYSFVKEVE